MKSLVLFLSIALFLPLALSSTFSSDLLLPSEDSSNAYPSVLDTDGNPLKVGVKYFVLPSLSGMGGGLILSRVVDKNVKVCPQDIVQDPNELHRGRPVEFFPAYPDKTGELILRNNPINVKFFSPSETSRCANFTVWKMDKKYKYVVGRGKLGILNNIRNWFRIVPYGKDYRYVEADPTHKPISFGSIHTHTHTHIYKEKTIGLSTVLRSAFLARLGALTCSFLMRMRSRVRIK
ncbi:miraculin-like isoform X1 [Lycium barbarum]|uniref:miraculin-like isoform X1 n=1 Tax=Lycium barbarum TaxID=112863 RepID=UPI00293E9F67|nr:miraculin-like isoform X1 [Lycium barbarum]